MVIIQRIIVPFFSVIRDTTLGRSKGTKVSLQMLTYVVGCKQQDLAIKICEIGTSNGQSRI